MPVHFANDVLAVVDHKQHLTVVQELSPDAHAGGVAPGPDSGSTPRIVRLNAARNGRGIGDGREIDEPNAVGIPVEQADRPTSIARRVLPTPPAPDHGNDPARLQGRSDRGQVQRFYR